MVMTGEDVVEVLELLEAAGVEAWVDGGWGIDALLGTETRQHADLDLAVPLQSVGAARRALGAVGFTTVRDWLPTAVAVRDPAGREVDLHPLTPSPDEGGDQAQLQGAPFHYPPPTAGTVAGRPVRCVPAEAQVRAHLGYPPTAKDRSDLDLLRQRFGVTLPPPYA
jgi:lincosamide nucleotidyltransferase A/C/D/E